MEFYGDVTWHSMSSTLVCDVDKLKPFREEFDPMLTLPKKPTPENLFKRTCQRLSSGEYKFGKVLYGGNEFGDFLESKIKLNGEPIGNIKLYNRSELEFITDDIEIQDDFQYMWDTEQNYVDHMAMRALIKSALEDSLEAVWLTSGTYFVPLENHDRLEQLHKIVGTLYDVNMQVIPLVQTDAQKTMLHDAYLDKASKIWVEIYNVGINGLAEKATVYKIKKVEAMIEKLREVELAGLQYGLASPYSQWAKDLLDETLEGVE